MFICRGIYFLNSGLGQIKIILKFNLIHEKNGLHTEVVCNIAIMITIVRII